MTVLTFSVQAGSGGYAIAASAARALGYHYYDWEITSKVERLAGNSHDVLEASARTTLYERIIGQLAAASAYEDELPPTMFGPSMETVAAAVSKLESESYRRSIEEIVKEIAARSDAVIVGHCSQVILQDEMGVLKILVRGSEIIRAMRIATEERTDIEEVLASLRRSDELRGGFLKRIYGVDWLDPSLYDLVLSTDVLSPIDASNIVLTAARGIAKSGS